MRRSGKWRGQSRRWRPRDVGRYRYMSRWHVTEADYAKPRRPGISGFMRLRNEAEFLDRTFETHLPGLDELVVVYNRCTDETPAICHRWQARYPAKISVFEYDPEIVPLGSPDAKTIDPRDEHSLANYYNWTLTRTTREIVIKVDGDHIGNPMRFAATCDRVRRKLDRDEAWPIYGLNITRTRRGVGIYNLYDFHPQFGTLGQRLGPPAFTTGDQSFYFVEPNMRHVTDPDEGYEKLDLSRKRRAPVGMTYLFFHMKGMKRDQGIGNWTTDGAAKEQGSRAAWIERVQTLQDENVASFGAMMLHNPQYFREADPRTEFRHLFPNEELMPDPVLPLTPARILESAKSQLCRLGLLRILGLEK